ncbi:MAG: cytochrome b [Planctomycetaceae bacterium]
MNALLNWLDDRTGYKEFLHEALYERIPGGARWRYVWGSTLVFAFMTQVITGVFLWMAYSPSSTTAWESVYYITYEMQFGWLLRGLHHFMAQAMVVLLAIHLMQVIVDGAYKAPREINFWLGLILMQIVLGLSLTGYLLPWDQKGYWATQVATKLMTLVPVIGTKLQRLVVGGPTYGHHTLTRFFAMHAGVLPGLLIGFLVLHIAAFRRHGITVPNPLYRRDSMFWPDQVLKDAVACLGVLMVVLLLTIFMGAELGAPADPSQPYSAARPEWYFLFLFQFLKYFPGETEIWGALIIPGLLFGVLALMPFLGKWKLGHRFNVAYMLIMLAGILLLTGQAWMEDNRGPKAADYQRAVADAEMKAHRVRELIAISEGISEKGGRALLRSDPKTAGPELV